MTELDNNFKWLSENKRRGSPSTTGRVLASTGVDCPCRVRIPGASGVGCITWA